MSGLGLIGEGDIKPCLGFIITESDCFLHKYNCSTRYFVARRMERFTGISRGQWSSSQIFLVQSRVYAINLLFATVVLIDLQLSLGFNDNIQLRSAQELIDQVKNDPKYKDYQLVLTGHSLGGWIGAKKGIENKIPTVTF